MRKIAIVLAATLAVAVPLQADGVLDVDSNAKARIYLDGEYVGMTPMTIRSLDHRSHEVRLQNSADGKSKVYGFFIPVNHEPRSHIVADFRPEDPRFQVIAEGDQWPAKSGARTYTRVRSAPQYRSSASQTVVYREEPRRYHRRGDGVNEKSRIRNVSLGVGALGLITGTDALTGAGFGGAIVNEIFNK